MTGKASRCEAKKLPSELNSVYDCACRTIVRDATKLQPRLLTALNLLPSMACEKSLSSRHTTMKRRQTLRMPVPSWWRKSALALKSGSERPVTPRQLHIALRLTLQATTGLDAVQVVIDIELEQNGRVVRGSPGEHRIDAFEFQRKKIQVCDKRIDDAYRIDFADIVFKTLGQQDDLLVGLAFDGFFHSSPR